MKNLALVLLCTINLTAFSQKVDWVNAPLNPIAFAYKLEHFQLKGDVAYYNGRHFDADGMMILLSNRADYVNYFYENGELAADSKGSRYNFNDQGYISYRKNYTYEYNSKGLITAEIQQSLLSGKKVETITRYSYDTNNRLIKKENLKDDKSNYYYTYAYKKSGDILQVTEERFEGTVSKWKTYYEFKNGRKILAKENNSDIVTKIEYKFDSKGNPIQEDYIQTNGVHDGFPGTIIYHSQAKNSKITIDNSNNSIKIYRNGVPARDIESSTLKNKKDIVLYEGLTQTYYKVDNIYGDSPNKQKSIIPQKISQGHEALAHLFDNKVDVYFRGDKIFEPGDIVKPITINDAMVVYHLPERIYMSFDYLFENFTMVDNSFYPGQILPPSSASIFYAKTYDGLVSSYKLIVGGTSIGDQMKVKGYLKGDVDLVVERKTDKQLFVLVGYSNALDKKVYQGKYYDKNEHGEIFDIQSKEASVSKDIANQNDTETKTKPTDQKETTDCTWGDCEDGLGIRETEAIAQDAFFSNGKANGYGYIRFKSNGDYYYGTFKDGYMEGYGMYTWKSSGLYYIGQWKSGKMHGYGYVKKGGDVTQAGYYEDGKLTRNMLSQSYLNKQWIGSCVGDCENGFGYYRYSDGSAYVGFFTNNNPNHIGSYSFKDGSAYIGEWQNGKRTGQGMESYTNGNSYRGGFVNGIRHGLGVYVDKNEKKISTGSWENGEVKSTKPNYNNSQGSVDLKHNSNDASNANISKEAKDYLAVYNSDKNKLKQHLKQLDDNLRKNELTLSLIPNKYAALIEEVYKVNKEAAFEFMMKMTDGDTSKAVLPMLSDETRSYIRNRARERVQKYTGSYSSKTN